MCESKRMKFSFWSVLLVLIVTPKSVLADPTVLDQAYLDAGLLKPGFFTLCKVAPGSASVFPFDVSVNGDVEMFNLVDSTAPSPDLVNPEECVDVHEDTDANADQVTITELVPSGYEVTRVAVWNVDTDAGGISFHEEPAGTDSISGAIDRNKVGCLALFYNDMDVGACWMTGGGVKFEPLVGDDLATIPNGNGNGNGGGGPKDTVGGVVFPACNADPSRGGQWNHVAHRDKIHIKGNDVDVVNCGNVPGIDPGSDSPVTPFNFIEFEGTGTVSGIHGNKIGVIPITFFGRVEDRNEPGNEQSATSGDDIDRYFLRVRDADGNLVYLVDVDGNPDTVDPITITGGNFQIHASSCDRIIVGDLSQ